MARIIPSNVDRLALAGGHAPELVTLERLRRELDPGLTVFHSVHWTREADHRTFRGEADFIIVNRAGRIWVMEQKNGSLDETGGGLVKRYRDGVSDPVLQVRRSVDNIKGKFRRVHRREPALVADYLVYCLDHRGAVRQRRGPRFVAHRRCRRRPRSRQQGRVRSPYRTGRSRQG